MENNGNKTDNNGFFSHIMTIILAKRHSYLPQLSKMKIKRGKKFLWHTETFEMVRNTSKLSELND